MVNCYSVTIYGDYHLSVYIHDSFQCYIACTKHYLYHPVTYDIIPSQLDESGEISIDKLTAYKTDLEYLDDHFQVHFKIMIIVDPYPLHPLIVSCMYFYSLLLKG